MSEGNAIDALFRGMFDAKASDLHLCRRSSVKTAIWSR
jgi:hypothetical protein